MSLAPIFVTGTQRSGTTLLFQILNSHPAIFVLNELWDFYPHLAAGPVDHSALSLLLSRRLRLTGTYLDPGAGSTQRPFDHLERAMAAKLETVGKSRWGLKDPHLTYHLAAFKDRFPEARFVIILRDARGVISSYLSRRWNVANVYYGARLWRDEVRLQLDFSSQYPESTLVLRFEDLLADPGRNVRELCEFIGEPFREDLLEFHKRRPEANLHAGNINIVKPIQREIAEKWRQKLSVRQVGVIERVAGERMEALDYPVEGRGAWLTPLHRFGYSVHQTVMTNYWWQRRTNWLGVRKRLRRLAPWMADPGSPAEIGSDARGGPELAHQSERETRRS